MVGYTLEVAWHGIEINFMKNQPRISIFVTATRRVYCVGTRLSLPPPGSPILARRPRGPTVTRALRRPMDRLGRTCSGLSAIPERCGRGGKIQRPRPSSN